MHKSFAFSLFYCSKRGWFRSWTFSAKRFNLCIHFFSLLDVCFSTPLNHNANRFLSFKEKWEFFFLPCLNYEYFSIANTSLMFLSTNVWSIFADSWKKNYFFVLFAITKECALASQLPRQYWAAGKAHAISWKPSFFLRSEYNWLQKLDLWATNMFKHRRNRPIKKTFLSLESNRMEQKQAQNVFIHTKWSKKSQKPSATVQHCNSDHNSMHSILSFLGPDERERDEKCYPALKISSL